MTTPHPNQGNNTQRAWEHEIGVNLHFIECKLCTEFILSICFRSGKKGCKYFVCIYNTEKHCFEIVIVKFKSLRKSTSFKWKIYFKDV